MCQCPFTVFWGRGTLPGIQPAVWLIPAQVLVTSRALFQRDCSPAFTLCCAQVILLLAALAAVPVMLLPKPIILRKRAAARSAQIESYGRVSPQDPEDGAEEHNSTLQIASASHHEEEFDFGEVAVHQVGQATLVQRQGCRWRFPTSQSSLLSGCCTASNGKLESGVSCAHLKQIGTGFVS